MARESNFYTIFFVRIKEVCLLLGALMDNFITFTEYGVHTLLPLVRNIEHLSISPNRKLLAKLIDLDESKVNVSQAVLAC